MSRHLIVAVCLLLAFGAPAVARAEPPTQVAEGHGKAKPKEPEKKPEGEEKHEAKKPPKPKPKKPDKEKNCQWEEDIEIEVDDKRLTVNQTLLKNVMRGGETKVNGYEIYADTNKLELKIRAPDGGWYLASMTRLGNPDEGCIFYMVGPLTAVDGEPPLY